ncbi:16S rRNA processing protein RimM [Candidatus Syntrophocurvum alkaliphilum]|uniref:Ribosome maturation factor RimM n=1 Tax=Candidatus Syntrophocurvum alkaliphilum TaxID=2293317 RepID=A0A6I6DL76_9FIRM|nr:ribosome maturation factor RimM [Candidatus Syntrophocurvum alkaliphilum]QGT99961.1 16S rRNA processing protein RimM [Candidatus Syntrophocurvum alkaliphilum]
MQSKELISIGKISGTHGVRGIIKVIPLTEFPERFNDLEEVIINKDSESKTFNIESVGKHKQHILLKLKEINTREEAQTINHAHLKIPENQVYPLPPGYYYHFQLIGLNVYDEEKGELGKIIDIIETGANDVYVIKSEVYGEILLPAIKQVIKDTDIDNNLMKVELLPGLLE